jgi:hypothetical protein
MMDAEYLFNNYWSQLYYFENFNHIAMVDRDFNELALSLAFIAAIALSLLDVWATTGLGIAAGTLFQNSAGAWGSAAVGRLLPIFFFSWFPIYNVYGGITPFAMRWHDFTWFAFADGGISTMFRLIEPIHMSHQFQFASVLIAFLAAVHMLLFVGIGSYGLSLLCWREAGSRCDKHELPPFKRTTLNYENTNVIIAAGAAIVFIVLVWIHTRSAVCYVNYYYDGAFLNSIQLILCGAVAATTIRAITAGVQHMHGCITAGIRAVSIHQILRLTIIICNQLRGWVLWAGLFVYVMSGRGNCRVSGSILWRSTLRVSGMAKAT